MGFNKKIHHRKSIRLRGYDYSQPGAYFITICTHQRQLLFGDIVDGVMMLNVAGAMVEKYWREIPQHYPGIELNEHVIMPNHFHGIVHVGALLAAPQSPVAAPQIHADMKQGAASSAPTLGKIVRRFKSMSAIAVNRCLNRQGQPVWQRNYHEHIIRNEEAYLKMAEYIQTNPLKWQEDTYYSTVAQGGQCD